jgi:pimeloyl-ACP methyl ester carboxylesterase
MIWIDHISSRALAGNLLGDPATRNFTVYLPAGYDASDKRYPVLYLLQGFGMGGVDPGQVSKTLDQAVGDGHSRELILIFVDGFTKFGGPVYRNSPTIGDYETFITQELVAQIDSSYRTLVGRDTRAITGCSMGGYGALHLAFTHPDVFSVAVADSVPYNWWSDAGWDHARSGFTKEPADFKTINAMPMDVQAHIALAAAAASNPAKPPFYTDMPFTMAGGQAQIVPEVQAKVTAISPDADVRSYLAQAVRLRGLMIYHGAYDSVEYAQVFDQLLSRSGVQHQYLEIPASHCNLDWTPVLRFVSDKLTH